MTWVTSLHGQGYEITQKLKQERDELNYITYTAAILSPYRNAEVYKYEKKPGHFVAIYESVLAESLKFSNNDTKIICTILAWIDRCLELFDAFNVVTAALMIKENKENWNIVVELASKIRSLDNSHESTTQSVERIYSGIYDNRIDEF